MDARFSFTETLFLPQNPFWFLSPITAPESLPCRKERPRPKANNLIQLALKLRMRGFVHPLSKVLLYGMAFHEAQGQL
jgi:hypothetical protein